MEFRQSSKLNNVCYEIRGPVMEEAARLEEQGHKIIKLNIGNPAPFGFEAPDEILVDMIRQLPTAQGYSDSKGIVPARRAVAQYYQGKGIEDIDIDDVYLGNGASELIQMCLQSLVDDGDEILVPMPDYPLWTACVSLAGGRAVHYRCVEDNDWQPDLEDIAAKVTDRTKAIVIINPNNPTGAVYSDDIIRGIVDIARTHGLMLLSDEIYDKILYDDATHTPTACYAPDLLCLTFNGLSKAYRIAGFRSGWMVLTGPKDHARSFIEGLDILANMRLCPNVPAQHVVATALGGYQTITDLVLPGGRLHEQRDLAHRMLNDIEGVTATKAKGALYVFPKMDLEQFRITTDEQFALDLLRSKKVLIVQGTGFNWDRPDHFRVVTLPGLELLEEAIGRIGEHLETIRR